jgi:hypothetical protein
VSQVDDHLHTPEERAFMEEFREAIILVFTESVLTKAAHVRQEADDLKKEEDDLIKEVERRIDELYPLAGARPEVAEQLADTVEDRLDHSTTQRHNIVTVLRAWLMTILPDVGL